MLSDTILNDLKQAMKDGDRDKVEVLRMVKTALQMAEIDAKDDFGDDVQLKIVAKEAKKRKDAAQMYLDGGDNERAEAELAEAEIIAAYLPEQMNEEEVAKIVDDVLAGMDEPNIGQVMGQVMGRVKGQADGGLVSKVVKEKLQ